MVWLVAVAFTTRFCHICVILAELGHCNFSRRHVHHVLSIESSDLMDVNAL